MKQLIRLGDVAPIKQRHTKNNSESVWLLNLEMVESDTGKIIGYQFVSTNKIGNSTCEFDNGNVLYSKLRPYLNKVVIPDREGFATSEMLPLKPDQSKISREYLTYYLRSPSFVGYISDKVAGAKMPRARTEDLLNAKLPLVSLSEQEIIVKTLDILTNLISLRKQQLDKLDELVKSRFIEMFGDPIRNPKGWPVKNFEDICSVITDGEHATPRRTTGGIYLLSARNVLNHSLQLVDVDFIDVNEFERIAKRLVPQQNDILVSCSGSIGRCCRVPSGLKFQIVRSVALLRFDVNVNPVFAEYLIASDELQRQIQRSATQSSQANLFQGKIRKLYGYIPTIELQNQFSIFVTKVDKSKSEIQKSLEKLETLKSALFQQYFAEVGI